MQKGASYSFKKQKKNKSILKFNFRQIAEIDIVGIYIGHNCRPKFGSIKLPKPNLKRMLSQFDLSPRYVCVNF